MYRRSSQSKKTVPEKRPWFQCCIVTFKSMQNCKIADVSSFKSCE